MNKEFIISMFMLLLVRTGCTPAEAKKIIDRVREETND